MKRKNIKFLLKYIGLGLLVAVAFYYSQSGFDIKAGSMLFLGVSFLVSSFWK